MKPIILYLSYTGLLEPLGRSQILAYLKRLSSNYSFVLVTFEKKEHLNDKNQIEKLKVECAEFNIIWKPKVYHKTPRLLATLYDQCNMLISSLRYIRKFNINHIHSRSYVASTIAWLCSKTLGVPFIFDMRALWVDELLTAGRLKKSSVLGRILKKLEYQLLKDTTAVVSLTNAGVDHLLKAYPRLDVNKFSVITTCVDLERFKEMNVQTSHEFVVGAMGTLLSGWFHLNWLFQYFLNIKSINENAVLKIVTKDDHNKIIKLALDAGVERHDLIILSSAPDDVAKNVADMDVALMFFKAETGKLGSAPTRLGELLACGIPVVGNTGVGDMAYLINRYKVGATLEGNTEEQIARSVNSLFEILSDVELKSRAKQAAKDYFSADNGAEKYRTVYNKLI